MRLPEIQLLGVRVHPLRLEEWNDLIADAVRRRRRLVIGSQNLHGIVQYHQSEEMRRFQSKALIRVDGMGVVAMGRLLGRKLTRASRLTWVDWMIPLMQRAAREGWRVFFIAGRGQVLDSALMALRTSVPGLNVDGHHGYLREPVDRESALSAARGADVLVVGMGMPAQERFILEHESAIDAPVILTCGAALEYVAGVAPTAPRWMGSIGLEWLHRLATNPRRLWRRYTIEPLYLIKLALQDLRYRESNTLTFRDWQ